MVGRGGTNVSNIPFEQRTPYRPRRRKPEKLTFSDRCICAFFGAILGLVLWTFGYVFLVTAALKASSRQPVNAQVTVDPFDRLPSFWWGWTFMTGFSLFGATRGPELMMDGFGNALRVTSKVGRALNDS